MCKITTIQWILISPKIPILEVIGLEYKPPTKLVITDLKMATHSLSDNTVGC
jgi:hypothetical protein